MKAGEKSVSGELQNLTHLSVAKVLEKRNVHPTTVLEKICVKFILFFCISVVDGTSKEVSLQDKSEAWSSWALVIFLGIALTLLIISIAIGLLAKMNSNTATQQRRQRAAAAAAAASANRHSAQMAVASSGKMNNHHDDYNNDTLISQAFQSPQELPDRSPDVIPHFKNGGGKKNSAGNLNFPKSCGIIISYIL